MRLCLVATAVLPVSALVPFGAWLASGRTLDALPEGRLLLALYALIGLATLSTWRVARTLSGRVAHLEASRVELRELYAEARDASLRDPLTGLGNHRAFQEQFQRMLTHAATAGVPLSLLLLDLDEFKGVNDASGHAAGDQLLAAFGRHVAGAMRHADRAFRIGGDEFAILFAHTDAEGARIAGRRLLARTLQPSTRPGEATPISFSAGVTSTDGADDAPTSDELYRRADAALYRAKRNGRTAVEIYDAVRDGPIDSSSRAELTAAVSRVISQSLLSPVYQPVVESATGRVLGYEGLIRISADGDFAGPGPLFAAAAQVGKLDELERACLDAVIGGAERLPDDAYLAVNLSPRSIESAEFNERVVLDLLERHGLDPRRLVLELTEREPVENLARLRANLATLRRAGIRLAADDVGAGNSGLRLLSQVRFDIVKIDLSLVQEGIVLESSLSVLTSLADLAARWGAVVVAEGVETPEQLEMVRGLGLPAAQGYLFGRPGPLPDAPGAIRSGGSAANEHLRRIEAVRQLLGLSTPAA